MTGTSSAGSTTNCGVLLSKVDDPTSCQSVEDAIQVVKEMEKKMDVRGVVWTEQDKSRLKAMIKWFTNALKQDSRNSVIYMYRGRTKHLLGEPTKVSARWKTSIFFSH